MKAAKVVATWAGEKAIVSAVASAGGLVVEWAAAMVVGSAVAMADQWVCQKAAERADPWVAQSASLASRLAGQKEPRACTLAASKAGRRVAPTGTWSALLLAAE